MSYELVLLYLGYFGVFFFMFLNGVCNFPPSQILYVLLGFFIAKDYFSFFWVVVFGVFGNLGGIFLLYSVCRSRGEGVLRFVSRFVSEKEIVRARRVFERRGLLFLFLGRLVSPLKLIVVVLSGVMKVNRVWFLVVGFVTGVIWAVVFLVFGYVLGKSFENLKFYGPIMLVLTVVVVWFYFWYSKRVV